MLVLLFFFNFFYFILFYFIYFFCRFQIFFWGVYIYIRFICSSIGVEMAVCSSGGAEMEERKVTEGAGGEKGTGRKGTRKKKGVR